LAGLPEEVVARAREVLANLEKGELDEKGLPRLAHAKGGEREQGTDQLNLFGRRDNQLYRELQKIDPNRLTPREALEFLYHWKKKMEEGD
jgi:DNA mismatch repair protein MutS